MIQKAILVFIFFSVTLYGVQITDMLGRNVEIQKSEKLVFLGPGALRLGVYMQLQDRLVAIEAIELKSNPHTPYRKMLPHEQLKKLPIVSEGGAAKMPNLEALMVLRPDIIFSSFLSPEQIRLIEQKTSIPVVALSYGGSYGGLNKQKKLQAVQNSFKLLGDITKKEQRAKTLIDFMLSLQKQLEDLEPKDARLYIGGLSYKGAQGITSTEPHYPPFELLGLQSSLLKKETLSHFFIQEEALLAYNPEFIFLDIMGKKMITEEIEKKKSFYSTLQAFQTHQVHWLLAYNFYNTNIENLYINSFKIAQTLGLIEDSKAKEEEILETFLGIKKEI